MTDMRPNSNPDPPTRMTPEEILSKVPQEPGVYLMKDREGHILYVGKAKNLKRRLHSYFSTNIAPDLKTSVLVGKIHHLETIITGTEKEALILESNLIKRHKPRYNVILKDDKRYPSLCLNVRDPYPFLSVVRKIKKDDNIYFGPYASASAVAQTLKVINKTFKLRKCRSRELKNRTRPCLNYQMNACLAPCCLNVDTDVYQKIVDEVILFLSGRTPDLLKKIKTDMHNAATEQAFEKAAALRDKMFAIEKTIEKQIVVSPKMSDRDVVAVVGQADLAVLTVLFVRKGFLQGVRHFAFNTPMASAAEIIEAFIRQYEERSRYIPPEILVSVQLENSAVLSEWLTFIKGRKVHIHFPQRGEKVRILEMALANAEKELSIRRESRNGQDHLLRRLQEKLRMPEKPARIECFDNSNLFGKSPVAGMVVFIDGKPDKREYRKFRIKSVDKPDDYAAMHEVLHRRFKPGKDTAAPPDLLMVDGGRGQLGIAISVLREIGIMDDITVIGIAKKEPLKNETADKIYLAGRANPLNLDNTLLFFLERIRDEAHRFAISYHRQRRARAAMQSELDAITGIGPNRKKILLKHFGSIKKIRAATLDDLRGLPGMNRSAAEAVVAYFNSSGITSIS